MRNGDPGAIMRLRIVLTGVRPAPWRRVEIGTHATLADLHAVIQTVMGWANEHLFCLRILGRHYDSERRLLVDSRLVDLRLRPGERFTCTYNYAAPWDHEVRVEAIGPADARHRYPRCTAGRHPCPPEWSSGPAAHEEASLELLGFQYAADLRFMAEIMTVLLDNRDGNPREAIGEENLDELERVLGRERLRQERLTPFNRRAVNAALREGTGAGAGASS